MFRVRWEEIALNQLADLWTAADSELRQTITATTAQIDRQLQTDPLGPSESRPEGRRILFLTPLGILFRMEADGHTVSVLRVWLFHNRNRLT